MTTPSSAFPHIYTTPDLDRVNARRHDVAWVDACRRDPMSRVVALSGLKPRVDDPGAARPRAVLMPASALPEDAEPVLLGLDGDVAVFAAEFGDHDGLPGVAVELREVAIRLPVREAGLLAYARALAFWTDRHRFCGRCGAPTRPEQGGHVRRCTACGLQHFPRTDPAIIVLVSRGERCLLGRSHRFPDGLYSTLAGFVEPGESVEHAVVREVFEESGVVVEAPEYRASQPWPFPSSLMLGFRARAVTEDIRLDDDELADVRWFTRGELDAAGTDGLRLPPVDSIARALIEDWRRDG